MQLLFIIVNTFTIEFELLIEDFKKRLINDIVIHIRNRIQSGNNPSYKAL